MTRYAEPSNFYADSSEDEASGHSSIFHASIYIAEEESIQILEKGKQSWASTSTTLDDAATTPTAIDASVDDCNPSDEHDPTRPETQSRPQPESVSDEAAFGTSVDSCATLVPNLRGFTSTLVDPSDGDDDDGHGERHRNVRKEKLVVYDPVNMEPLYVYASPKEPTEAPPKLPGPQRRADTLAEILFRQDMQTYGLQVSTSTAAMTYFRRNEYHEALRATDFNFRAVQSQQRTYGDLRNHPFYNTIREDSPLLRSSNQDGRRRHQRRNNPDADGRANSTRESEEPGIWTVLLEVLCCITAPADRLPSDATGNWH
ncbi:hypothetical protein TWF696_002756 [Orbilia brochopaga]|uniref:Uncharacterized protein n=1 Tax=Orbilia brochopaga TaxID=3140254 RepID=A0AAV9U2L9_9PEZI